MIDLIQIQKDLFGLLMSAPQLATVNIVEERKFILDHLVEVDAIWQTQRPLSGINYSGNGLLIETPEVICDSNGVSGPPQIVVLSFVSFQNGDAAFTPMSPTSGNGPQIAGGGLFAEQIEQYLIDILHLLTLGGIGTMQVTGHFSEPARDYPGINARRTKINFTPSAKPQQTLRTAIVTVTVSNGEATLTTATPGAAIYYTLDGSFPSTSVTLDPITNTPINPSSTLYAAPFAVASGQVIRATAYLNGYNPGQIISITAP